MPRYLLGDGPKAAPAARRRKAGRKPVFTVAALLSAERFKEPLECTLRDRSDTGARFELDRDMRKPAPVVPLPRRVIIRFCADDKEVDCRLIWQDGTHFGVEFIGQPGPGQPRPAA